MTIEHFKNIYFIGIGGIGMSALARHFKILGKNVAGYDKTETQLTKELENQEIEINFQDNLVSWIVKLGWSSDGCALWRKFTITVTIALSLKVFFKRI